MIKQAAHCCEYCGLAQTGQEATFHIDHVVPVVAGGESTLGFAETACEIFRYLLGIGGKTRTAKKVLTHALPTAVVDEELHQPRFPLSVSGYPLAPELGSNISACEGKINPILEGGRTVAPHGLAAEREEYSIVWG